MISRVTAQPARRELHRLANRGAFAFAALLLPLLPGDVVARQAVVRGTVTALGSKEPIVGATVFLGELNLSTLTTARGAYTLTIPAARIPPRPLVLTARAIGFRASHRSITLPSGEQVQDFSLATDINRLEEVVVTGVQEQVERAKVPFTVGRVTAEDLVVPAVNPLQALQGKVAGVRVASTSGKPGTTPEILLRGPTSLNGTGRGLGPLIIVDDAIMNVEGLQELGGLDIASIEVVKGAAGASLYGTRAANGVITIRTHRGLSGADGVRLSARSEFGFSDWNVDWGVPANHTMQLDETGKRFCVVLADVAPCSRTLDWMTELRRINNVVGDTVRAGQVILNASPQGVALRNTFQASTWPGRYYNGAAQILSYNPTILSAVDASGKAGSVSYYVSGQYASEGGALKELEGAVSRRARVNLDYQARSDLKVSVSSLYSSSSDDLRTTGGRGNVGNGGGGIFSALMLGSRAGTDFTARDTLGRLLRRTAGSGATVSPNGTTALLYDGESTIGDRSSSRFLGSITARYFPTSAMTFEGTLAYDHRTANDLIGIPKGYRTFAPTPSLNGGQVDLTDQTAESMNLSLTATLRSQLGEGLQGKLSLRGLYDDASTRLHSSGGDQLRVAGIYQTSNATSGLRTSSSSSATRNIGLFAGATLDFQDRYLLEGSFRYDGSSRFGAGNRWAPFGRLSALWRVSEEPWYRLGFLDQLRFRASRGTAGSTPPFEAQYEAYTVTASGFSLNQTGNRFLRPETTTEVEVGTDFELFKRVGVEITYAHATTRDQIVPVTAAAGLGFASQWRNIGTLVNRTWEVAATVPVISKPGRFWQLRASWDRVRTFISELFVPDFAYNGGTAQGTGFFFLMTADRTLNNGFPMNRFGNIWGRKFLTSCSELPAPVRNDCGGPESSYQVNDEGWLVWVGQGSSWRDGITRNLWQTVLPATESPWGVPLSFGHPIVDRPHRGEPDEGQGTLQVLGNVLPDFRLSVGNDVVLGKLRIYALLDATIGHDINNQAESWGLLDFNSAGFDQAGKSVETAKPAGYSWRVGPPESTLGTGGFYDVLNANNYSVEDGSYLKFREMSVSYHAGPLLGIGDWTVGVVGRNLFTISGYRGIDPEVGSCQPDFCPSGSGLVNQTDGFQFPSLRTFTFSLSTRF